jgi:hypothetical protein
MMLGMGSRAEPQETRSNAAIAASARKIMDEIRSQRR